MQMRLVPPKVGEMVKVRSVPCGYPLPAGLPEEATVKLGEFDLGYHTVEFEGNIFRVFMLCVEHERVYWIGGKWLPENSTVVQENRARLRHVNLL